jgi:hypothetical protein
VGWQLGQCYRRFQDNERLKRHHFYILSRKITVLCGYLWMKKLSLSFHNSAMFVSVDRHGGGAPPALIHVPKQLTRGSKKATRPAGMKDENRTANVVSPVKPPAAAKNREEKEKSLRPYLVDPCLLSLDATTWGLPHPPTASTQRTAAAGDDPPLQQPPTLTVLVCADIDIDSSSALVDYTLQQQKDKVFDTSLVDVIVAVGPFVQAHDLDRYMTPPQQQRR